MYTNMKLIFKARKLLNGQDLLKDIDEKQYI